MSGATCRQCGAALGVELHLCSVKVVSGAVIPPGGSVDLDALAKAQAEIRRLAKARAKLAECLRRLAEHEHRDLTTHREYPFEMCPFVGCRENAYALRLGKPRRKAAGS